MKNTLAQASREARRKSRLKENKDKEFFVYELIANRDHCVFTFVQASSIWRLKAKYINGLLS